MWILEYLNPIRNAIRIFSQERAPRQLALAVAIGMVIGLLPKGNLMAASAMVCLLALRVNLGAGLTAAFLVTLASPWLDRLTHGIGLRLLRHPVFHEQMSDFYQWPIVAWTSLNNTVVLGSFLLGVVMFYPTYRGSKSVFQIIVPRLEEAARRYRQRRQLKSLEPQPVVSAAAGGK